MKRALPILAVAAVLGCSGATTSFTRTGPTLPALPEKCDFAVIEARPSTPSTEIGTIELKYMKQTDWLYEESAFKRKVRPLVCRNGGDTAIATKNDNGLYLKATVLTTRPVASAAAVKAPPPEAPVEAVESEAAPEPTPAPVAANTAKAEEPKKAESPKEAEAGKKGGKKSGKKGASAKSETPKKDDADVRGKDGKIDIDKLL